MEQKNDGRDITAAQSGPASPLKERSGPCVFMGSRIKTRAVRSNNYCNSYAIF